MNFENILYQVKNGICTITINRPSKLNALNKSTIKELHEAFHNADDNDQVQLCGRTNTNHAGTTKNRYRSNRHPQRA